MLIEKLKNKMLLKMQKMLSESAENFIILTHLKNYLIYLNNQQHTYFFSRQKINTETETSKKTSFLKSTVTQKKVKTITVSTQETVIKSAAVTFKSA